MNRLKSIFENHLKNTFQNISIYPSPFKKVMRYSLLSKEKLASLVLLVVWEFLQKKDSSKKKILLFFLNPNLKWTENI